MTPEERARQAIHDMALKWPSKSQDEILAICIAKVIRDAERDLVAQFVRDRRFMTPAPDVHPPTPPPYGSYGNPEVHAT